MSRRRALVATSALLLVVSACGSGDDSGDGAGGDRLQVATSLYPLEFAVEQVGGEHVDVTNLTQAGADPHDLELTPKQILTASEADQLIYLKQFQPSIDDAAEEAGDTAFDVAPSARLDIAALEHDHGHEDEEGHDHEGDEGHDHDHEGDEGHDHDHEGDEGHDHEGEDDHAGHDHGTQDPHFWLDPTRYADVADAIAERLAEDDPDHAEDYRANAEDFRGKLTTLDEDLTSAFTECTQTDLVTGHAAFAYFADRYGFDQKSISGLTPGAQPSPSEMADLIEHIKEEEVSTVYAETLVPQDLAETIARDSDAEVAVLDPLEGITDDSEGEDYFEVMRSNLDAVEKGQECR